MKDNKIIIYVIIGAVILSSVSFYGGMHYRSFSRGGMFQTGTGFPSGMGVRQGMLRGGGFTTGEIVSKDATSLTIKMPDGSTKIIILGGSTSVMMSAPGTLDNLSVGTNVVVTGTTNSDKSVTAESIQIRPATSVQASGQ